MNPTTGKSFAQPYLFFNGQCEAAMEFYREAIGAELDFTMRFKESPEPPAPGMVPPCFENKIMHCTFHIGATTLMASDGCSAEPARFEGFSLSLSVPNAAEAERAFAALSNGGAARMPLAKTFWSPCFGIVQDRFGIGWMISVAASE